MLKLAFIGCSWTQGLNIPYTNTYPYIVHELLNNSNKKNQVVNAGRSGTSWFNYPQTLKYIHNQYDPDLYVIQHTTPDRGMLLWCSDKKKYSVITRDHDVYDNYIQLWDNSQCYYHLTPGMAESLVSGDKPDVTDHMFSEIERKSGLKKDDVIRRVKYWLEHERLHPLMFDKYQETVEYCNLYVDSIGKKIINLFWLDNSFVVPIQNQIVVEKEINFKKYVVDDGYHFDNEGNNKLAHLLINRYFNNETI
jgi:hypothetical protein